MMSARSRNGFEWSQSMPVKVRCSGCEQVLNVPDKARGKMIACPKCSEKIKVPAGPAGDDAPPAKSAPSLPKATGAKPKPKAKPAKGNGEFLGGLDDYGIEDQEEQICPYCAAPLEEDDAICPGCGRDLATGQMDKKEGKKRSKEGKSSAAFYKNVFRESWEFMWEFKSLALRTGVILSVFSVMYMACFFMVLYCEKMPPRIFWIAMTIVMAVGSPGWVWFLTRKIVTSDLYTEKLEADRIFYDFFTNVALGLAAFLWPCVVNLPWLLPTATVIYSVAEDQRDDKYPAPTPKPEVKKAKGAAPVVEEPEPYRPWVFEMISAPVYIALVLGIGILPGIAFPIATVHMVAKHQHKAWIGWELIKLIFHNLGPIIVYHSVSLVMGLIFGGTVLATVLLGGNLHLFNNETLLGWTASLTNWIYAFIDSSPLEPGSFMFVLFQMPMMFTLAFLIVIPFMIALGFPLLYQMKINGLIAKHFSHSLDLDQRILPFSPAGFWVRFLAGCVDTVLYPLAPLIVTRDKRFVMLGLLLYGIIIPTAILYEGLLAAIVYALAINFSHWMYYSVSHSGTIRATLGMEAFGLIVIPDIPNPKQKDLDKVLTLGQASYRWFMILLLTPLTAGINFIMCAFHKEKKALHDIICKSKIVFEGDK